MEISNRIGYQDNNSRFLLPNPQSTARVELRYTQPLLNGAGRCVNLSRVMLAELDASVSQDELVTELQDHLLSVTEAYWQLYLARAECLQKQRILARAEEILRILEGRKHADALTRQRLRAQAAVAKRRSDIARCQTSIRNAESRLRLLVNDPVLLQSPNVEFTPEDAPTLDPVHPAMQESIRTALMHRPDISRAIREIRGAAVRLDVAENQILPKLDLLVGSYLMGLERSGLIGSAYGNQFAAGRPSFSAGLLFEQPFGNRAAHARFERRQWEMARAMAIFRSTVETTVNDVEVAVREVDTTYREMVGKQQAMVAAANETDYLEDRWQVLPGADDSTILLLENLLDAQDRLLEEELEFARATVAHAVSLTRLKQQMGVLLTISR